MALAYVSPAKMAEYRTQILLFAKGAPSLDCIRSHFIPERTGICSLTGAKELEDIFVLANRAGATLKVSRQAMQIVANVIDLTNAGQWFEHLRLEKKAYRDRQEDEAKRREEDRKAASKTVVVRRRNPTTILKTEL